MNTPTSLRRILATAVTAGSLGLALALGSVSPAAATDGGPARIGPGYSANRPGVTCVQKFLGFRKVNGTYGKATYEAVKAFQTKHKLQIDGAVGPATAQAMRDRGLSPTCSALLPRSGASVSNVPRAPKRPVSVAAVPSCTGHRANTASWMRCPSNGRPYWARLNTTCKLAFGKVLTHSTRWELVPARGGRTVSDSCTRGVVRVDPQTRPY